MKVIDQSHKKENVNIELHTGQGHKEIEVSKSISGYKGSVIESKSVHRWTAESKSEKKYRESDVVCMKSMGRAKARTTSYKNKESGAVKKKLIVISLIALLVLAYVAEQMNRKSIYNKVIDVMSREAIVLEEAGTAADEIYRSTGNKREAVSYWNSIVNGL